MFENHHFYQLVKFLICKSQDNNNAIKRLLWIKNKDIMDVKDLIEYLIHSKFSVDISYCYCRG